jgi:hypothetical protein
MAESKDPPQSTSNEALSNRIRDLENTLAATRAGMPLSLIPEHGAGVGTDVEPTWSQADQEAAIAADFGASRKR